MDFFVALDQRIRNVGLMRLDRAHNGLILVASLEHKVWKLHRASRAITVCDVIPHKIRLVLVGGEIFGKANFKDRVRDIDRLEFIDLFDLISKELAAQQSLTEFEHPGRPIDKTVEVFRSGFRNDGMIGKNAQKRLYLLLHEFGEFFIHAGKFHEELLTIALKGSPFLSLGTTGRIRIQHFSDCHGAVVRRENGFLYRFQRIFGTAD